MKLEEAIHFLDEGLDIRRCAWQKFGMFVRKNQEYCEEIQIPSECSGFCDGKAYNFVIIKGTRLFINHGQWSVPWFCGLSERKVNDWEVIVVEQV